MALHKILAFVFCVVSASALTAQNLITNQYALGGTASSGTSQPFIDAEGNYYLFIVVNVSGSQNSGNLGTEQYGDNFFVISKHAPNHDLIWRHAYGGDSTEFLGGVSQLSDGFVVTCRSNSPNSGTKTIDGNGFYHIWLQKINFEGNVVWQKGIFATDHIDIPMLHELNDGNLLICTSTQAGLGADKTAENIGSSDFWLLKINTTGEIIWDVCVGTEDFDFGPGIFGSFSNGDFLIGSRSFSGISGDKTEESFGDDDMWILRLSQNNGEIIWDKTIGGSSSDGYFTGAIANDETHLFSSSYSEISGLRTIDRKGIQDYWYLRLNNDGEIMYQSCFGGSDRELNLAIHSITSNEMFIMIGSNSSVGLDKNEESRGEFDLWLIRADLFGNILHQKTIGGDKNDFPSGIVTMANGNLLVASTSKSGISGEKTVNAISNDTNHAWILEIDAVTLDIVNEHQVLNQSTVFPNPASTQINISFTEATQLNKAVLYDLNGKIVREQSYAQSFDQAFLFSTKGLAGGVYTLSLVGDGFVKTQQVVVE